MPSLTSPFSLLALAMDAGNGTFLDHVATRPNLRRACRHVVGNRGAPGADGETVHQLSAAWSRREDEVLRQLRSGAYTPAAIRRCAIPKAGGKGVRVLGIPTVQDRIVQQAVAQALTALLDEGFSPHSFGFRPDRCAHDALRQAAQYVEEGMSWVLHLDLERFFDRAPHNLVLARLRERANDPRLLKLVRDFLTAPFATGGRPMIRNVGLPQGGPLSPLLANLLLDGLDQRLFNAGFHFCRYADDICLYFHTRAEAWEALRMIAPWIEQGLKLRINRRKTRIVPVAQDVFLGYRLRVRRGRAIFAPASESCERLQAAVRGLLDRNRTANPRALIGGPLASLLRGWTHYFSLTEDRSFFVAIDRMVVFEIRGWLWRRIRDPRRQARGLIERGISAQVAWMLVSGQRGTVAGGETKAICDAYPMRWLRTRGWVSCTEYFHPQPQGRSGVEVPKPCDRDPAAIQLEMELENESRIAARGCELYEWECTGAARKSECE